MTNRSMERRLADAVNKTAPQNADGVLSRCQERKGTITVMTEKRLARRRMAVSGGAYGGVRGFSGREPQY